MNRSWRVGLPEKFLVVPIWKVRPLIRSRHAISFLKKSTSVKAKRTNPTTANIGRSQNGTGQDDRSPPRPRLTNFPVRDVSIRVNATTMQIMSSQFEAFGMLVPPSWHTQRVL